MIKKYIADSDKEILVALYCERIVGMASMMYLSRLNHTTPEMYIPEMIVSSGYQNQGIGKKLMSQIVSLAKKRDCHRIRLESGNKRTGAHQFYKNLRFVNNSMSFAYDLKKF